MEVFIDDAGYVRAPAALVYRRLTDVAGWSSWWPGIETRRSDDPDDGETWLLGLRPTWTSAVRLRATLHGWRHDTGVRIRMSGDIDGDAEFWLEPLSTGTIVHHLLVGQTALRPARRVQDTYRRAIRRGLWGLKDALHLEVRTMAGLRP
jgi:hypothetical protein